MQKVFAKVIKNGNLGGLSGETPRSIKREGEAQALKVRVAEFA
jgi:hypothetical protein